MKRIVVSIIAVIVMIALAGFSVWFIQNSQKPYARETGSIAIGEPTLIESSGLIYIADDQHFFADNGLNVTIKSYDTGFNAVNGMLKDENDIAVATEFVIVGKAFQ